MMKRLWRSITHRTGQMIVKPSPFNGVKLDLGFLMIIAIPLIFLSGKLFDAKSTQIAFLMGYGVLAMVWLVGRAYWIKRHYRLKSSGTLKK